MSQTSRWAHLIQLLRRLIQALGKYTHTRKIGPICRRLLAIWGLFYAKVRNTRLWKKKKDDGPDGSLERSTDAAGAIKLKVEEQVPHSLTTTTDEGIISLDDVACSAFPGGLRNNSKISLNRSHEIHERNLSRPSSAYSSQFNLSNHDNPSVPDIVVQSPRSPHRQFTFSASTPALPSSSPIRIVDHDYFRREPKNVLDNAPSIHSASPMHNNDYPPLHDSNFAPLYPESMPRYDKRQLVSDQKMYMEAPPLKIIFKDHADPPGWKFFCHLEGQPYFFHEEKRVFTDVNLFDPTLRTRVENDLAVIEGHIKEHSIIMPRKYDLVVDLNWKLDDMGQRTKLVMDYYFADHKERKIFFLDEWDPSTLNVWNEVRGVYSFMHLGYEMEAQYWYHVQMYPSCISLRKQDVRALRDVAMHYIGDLMTSPTSTSPYSLEELHKILGLLSSVDKNIGTTSPGSLTLVARFMTYFARAKFYNWHGLPCARLERHRSIYGAEPHRRTALIRLFSPFLFSAPDVHLRTLSKLWQDGLLHKAVYEEGISKLKDEWQELVLFSTVLLNANVAFLSIQTVDDGNGRSAVQLASYISTLMSTGSVILGLLLVRQLKTKNRETASDMQQFLNRRSHPTMGLEVLAILFSLPYALLLWGMITFLLSFALTVLRTTGIPTRVLFSACGFIIATFIAWCVYTGWEQEPYPNYEVPLPNIDEEEELKEKARENSKEAGESQRPLVQSPSPANGVLALLPDIRSSLSRFFLRRGTDETMVGV